MVQSIVRRLFGSALDLLSNDFEFEPAERTASNPGQGVPTHFVSHLGFKFIDVVHVTDAINKCYMPICFTQTNNQGTNNFICPL